MSPTSIPTTLTTPTASIPQPLPLPPPQPTLNPTLIINPTPMMATQAQMPMHNEHSAPTFDPSKP